MVEKVSTIDLLFAQEVLLESIIIQESRADKMSKRKFFTGDVTVLTDFDGDTIVTNPAARDVHCSIVKELQYQQSFSGFLEKKKTSLNSDMLAKELSVLSSEARRISELNERMKTLSDQLKAKEDEQKKLTVEDSEARDARPSVQQMFAEDLTTIQTRLDTHSAKSKALIDENNALRTEFRDLLKAHDESDQVVVERLKLVDELHSQAILKQQNFVMRREKQGEISALYLEDVKKYQGSEKTMKQQLETFNKRFTEFETELNKSNAVFATYKKRMDDMQAVIEGLESDKVGLAAAYSKAVLDLRKVEERTAGADMVENAKKLSKQTASLDKLIATLQLQKDQLLSAKAEHPVEESEEVANGST